jgi:uncharacterized membrane protein YphA (DoxX/SURF4 family)
MQHLRTLSRILVGIVFTFSGFVKAVDPMGSTYKFQDYFNAFGLESLAPTAFFLAILLSSIEFILGMALLFNARIRNASWLALAFMAFFTPLTLVLALTNPVTDCGCFGDALKMTNWQTFGKNVVIIAFTLLVFLGRKKIESRKNQLEQHLLLIFSTVFVIGISIYSYKHNPIIDFRPYHIGANIQEGMSIPEGAPADEYQSIFYYEKNGEVKEFDQTNYPWQDSTWKYVDSKQIKIKEGYQPPIHDFSISNDMEGDITDMVLNDENYTFLLVSKNVAEANTENQSQINEIATFCQDMGYRFLCLTASLPDEITKFTQEHQAGYPFYNTDEIQLKTIVRSNPGLVLLQKGTILNKWHYKDLPHPDQLKGNLAAESITLHQKSNIKLLIISITSTLLLLICFYFLMKYRRVAIQNRLRL